MSTPTNICGMRMNSACRITRLYVSTFTIWGSNKPMKELDVTSAADITPVTTITDTEAQIDMVRLRSYRLQRLRQQLVNFDVAGCVLFSPLSIRYATGVRNCALFHTHIVSSYLFVPTYLLAFATFP